VERSLADSGDDAAQLLDHLGQGGLQLGQLVPGLAAVVGEDRRQIAAGDALGGGEHVADG
jgi:hypothetical protein